MIPLPSRPKIILGENNGAVIEIEGLYPGYGQTIGNSLRRILLSSLKGAAITSIKIEGVGHEFSAIEGMMEDVVELMLNLKQMRFRVHEGDGPFMISLSASGEKEVTAGDFKTPPQIEIVTPDLPIATLTAKKSRLAIEATVACGLGYLPVEAREKDKVEVGVIALDAAFSPVRHVNYTIENMRIGDRTDYNKVRFHIETDGSLTPEEAFRRAAEILVRQFEALTRDIVEDEEITTKEPRDDERDLKHEDTSEETQTLRIKLEDLKLSSRTLNALREAGIKTVGGLARKREHSLLAIDGIGEKGIQEIKKALGSFGIILKQ